VVNIKVGENMICLNFEGLDHRTVSKFD